MSSHQAESGESNQSLSRPHVNKSYLKFTDAAGKETDLTHEIQFGNLTCPCTVQYVLLLGAGGRIQSPNSATPQLQVGLNYRICVRQEKGTY